MLKFQVSVKPSIEFPVISETREDRHQRDDEEEDEPGAAGKLEQVGDRGAPQPCDARAHDWMIGSKIEVHSSWSSMPLKS